MNKLTKRIMAFVLSLVMLLGCVPSFINEADAIEKDYYELILSNIKFNMEYGYMGLTFEGKVATYCGVEGGGDHFQIANPIDGVDCLDAYLEPIYDNPGETPQEPTFVSEDIGGDTLYYRLRIETYGIGKFDGTKTLKVKAPGCTIELPSVTRRNSGPSPSGYDEGTGYYLDNDQLIACIDFRLTDKVTDLDLTYSSFYGKYDGLRFNESNNSLTATGFDLKTTDENIGLKNEDILKIYSNSDGSGSTVDSFTDGVTYYVYTSLYISEGDIRTFSNEYSKYNLMINGNKVNLADLHPNLYTKEGKDNANLVFYAPLTAKKIACFDFKGDFDLITHDTKIVDRNQPSVTLVDEKTNTEFDFTPYVKWYKTYYNPTDSYTDEVTTGEFEEDFYYVMGSIDFKSYMGYGDPQTIINDAKTNGFNILWPSLDIDSTYEDEHNYIRKYINPRVDIDPENSTFTFRGQIDICPMPEITNFEIESFDENSLTIKLTGTNLFSFANHNGYCEVYNNFVNNRNSCNFTNTDKLEVNATNTEAIIKYTVDDWAPKFEEGEELDFIIGGNVSSQIRFLFSKSFTLGNASPKTPITSVKLNGKGSLISGLAINKQTLKYTEVDGTKYKSNDDKGKTWYTTSACDIPTDTIVAGTKYYKKITLDPVDGYKFDTILNVPVTNGTFISATPNGKKLDVVVEATAAPLTQIDITMDQLVVGNEVPYTYTITPVHINSLKAEDPGTRWEQCWVRFGDPIDDGNGQLYVPNAKELTRIPYPDEFIVEKNRYAITFDISEFNNNNASLAEVNKITYNGTSLPKLTEEDMLNIRNCVKEGFYYNPSTQVIYVCKIIDLRQSSGGGHKKKKTEEPKQDEPKEDPKTLEEKLQDELKKDDVKKANSNEGEKINPSAKYINGYDDGSFKPNNKVNNIELMSMVTELFDNVEIKETKDLNQGKDYWGQEIIDKANALGLIPGNKNNKKYNLSDEVTRGDLAVVVYNLVKDYTDAPSLKDRNNCKDAIGKNYEKEAAKLLELGIFKGYDDGMFHGDYTLTRAEAVVVINRALKSLGFEIKMPSIKLSFPDLSKEHWAYAEIMYAANK